LRSTLKEIPQNMIGEALKYHQNGRLDEAEKLYRRMLEMDPNHADSWNLLGVVAYQTNRYESASNLIRNAIRIDKKNASFHSNLGLVLQAQKKWDEAVARYKRALTLMPDYAEAHYNLANALREKGKLEEAATRYKRVLELMPDHANAHCNLSAVLDRQGKVDEAVVHGEHAVILRPDLPDAHFNLANFFRTQGRLDEAAARYKQALSLKPDYVDAHCSLGHLFLGLKRWIDAAAHFGQAIALKPERADLYNTMGLVLSVQERFGEAATYFERALLIQTQFAEARNNLGLALLSQGYLDEAVLHFEEALTLKPEFADAHNNLGNACSMRHALDEAMAHYKQALILNPELDGAHANLAMCQLRSGDLASGWHNYEKSPLGKRPLLQPQWKGEPLNGARILLHAEQGLGDSIQFLRYVPLVQAAGGTVVLELQDRLRRIAAELPGVADLVSCGDPLPAFDCHSPLMSIALAFGTTLDTIPAQVPYLSAPMQALKDASAFPWPIGGLRVGLAWHGQQTFRGDRYRYRSIPFSLLGPLFGIDNIHLFSLQMGEGTLDLENAPDAITDLSPYVRDMADTAAQIMNLDLVISVDTSVAHLASSLGIPTWTLLPYVADWRWLQEREDSPWYPGMRLFRQPSPGDWVSVIDAVCNALGKLCAGC
jgi:tetratricopeptide (TPR) repeat protein